MCRNWERGHAASFLGIHKSDFWYSTVFYLLIIIAEVLPVGELLSGLGPKDVLQGLRCRVLLRVSVHGGTIFDPFVNKDITWTKDYIFLVVADFDPMMVAKPFYSALKFP